MSTSEGTTGIVSVWSSYGHAFMSTDPEGHEVCLTCGATYALVPEEGDSTSGRYVAANGDAPMACTGDTGRVHGLHGERYCHEHQHSECEHVTHECNCLFCDS